jgi:S1-C subfamily serine protease
VRFVDNAGGAALNVLALALVAWVIASVVAYVPNNNVTKQVNGSIVLRTMDSLLPDAARSAFNGLGNVVSSTAVPRVFAGLAAVPGPEVDAPAPAAAQEAVEVIRDSTVRLTGTAPACDAIVSGSGFAVGPELVVTNAHVVAGVDDLLVRVRPDQTSSRATVVYFDPNTDVAIVRTRGLQARPARLAVTSLKSNDSAVIAGFPRGERFTAEPARVRARVDARGESIYGDTGVQRDIYVLRGSVQQGNSGGPLTDEFGDVHGMVFASGLEEQDAAYALTADEIRIALEAAGAADRAVSNGSCELR